MLVRAQEWPRNPERTLILGDARGQPPVRWVLLVSALLCGIMVSGAAFTIAWRSEARHRGAAQARLTDQHARVSELTRRTRRLRMAFVRERVALMRERRRHATTTHAVIVLRKELQSSDSRRGELERNAASVAGAASSLRAELEAIAAYIRRGSPLDPGYLSTQLGYVEQKAASLGAPAAPAGGASRR